ncbi:indole-3-glycerol phosphate synthase [Allostreptomyces psammosilenae]|uniref:Indole-3-glycerol phosphate synthase n=1 Tax=Allostreptomyces psammosilenae TaxID=1892865 RepID=A0A852ZY84_9ACTN|nr:indole-3-glycerol phosphate synthase [Allostreptomyces psammosilenae]NYI03232.1 hypothetical protein [Allostreptomyces psammosilenae]
MFSTILMIEKPLSTTDVALVTTLHGEEPVTFTVLMQPRGRQDELLRALDDVAAGRIEEVAREREETDVAQTPTAEHALEATLRALREAGAEATGRIVADKPVDALKDLVAETGADEVIVLTEPHTVEEFFHRDWASRARHAVGVPVLKLLAHADHEE